MWTVKHTVGRLVEARFASVEAGALTECLTAIADTVARAPQRVIGIFDLARARVLSKEETELLVNVMRVDNPHVERTAIIVTGDALLEKQMERLVRAAGLPYRRVFRLRNEALYWLSECLSTVELAQARSFLSE